MRRKRQQLLCQHSSRECCGCSGHCYACCNRLDHSQGNVACVIQQITVLIKSFNVILVNSTPFPLQRKGHIAEVKITIIFAYFLVFLLLVNSRGAVYIAEGGSFKDAANSYFLCEAVGYVQGKCSRESFEQYSYPLLDITFYITALFLPIVPLLHLINCRILKESIEQLTIVKIIRYI